LNSTWFISKLTGFRGTVCSTLQTLVFPAWARLWGVQLAERCTLVGWPILFRHRDSTIRIGKNLSLRSSLRSNFIGVNRPCYIATAAKGAVIVIGDDCGFTSTVVSGKLSIQIGNRVLCGANTTITDSDWHHIDPTRRRDTTGIPAVPVVIEDNVWLGMNVTVLKGVRIGRDTVVAAGSIVTSDLPAGVIAAGSPARPRRMLDGSPIPTSLHSFTPEATLLETMSLEILP
jgi:acetyltransferase-like isoleucine patch superfamily enzyme